MSQGQIQENKISLDEIIRLGNEITNWRKTKKEGGGGKDFFKVEYRGNSEDVALEVVLYQSYSGSGDSQTISVTSFSKKESEVEKIGYYEYRIVPSGFLGLGSPREAGNRRLSNLYDYVKGKAEQSNLFQDWNLIII